MGLGFLNLHLDHCGIDQPHSSDNVARAPLAHLELQEDDDVGEQESGQRDHGGQVHVEHVGGPDGAGRGELLHEVIHADRVHRVDFLVVVYLDLP